MMEAISMILDIESYQRILSIPLGHCQAQNRKLLKVFMRNQPGGPWNQRQMAEFLDIDEGRFSLIYSNKRGSFGKELEGRDVIKCLFKGVYNVEDLGLNTTNRDEALLKRIGQLIQKPDWLEVVFKCMDTNVDLPNIVSPVLKTIEGREASNIIKPLSDKEYEG